MKLVILSLVLCACVWTAAGDVAHLKAAKARLVGKLSGRGRHHKRGVLSAVPPFKLGHDIPHVHHSVVKPLVVTYPPTAVPVSVKVPLRNPLVHRYPVPVGHRVPNLPHPHYGLKFPHHKAFAKPDQHFHHHHHHVAPRPVVPVVPATPVLPAPPTQVVPIAQPTIPVARPVPAPPPVFVHHPAPASLIPAQPLPVSPPPVHVLPPHLHLRPTFPTAAVAIQPAAPVPLVPYAPQYNYVIRPGNAVQTSFFATYPRYPLVNYQTPIVPVPQPTPVNQVFLERPAQVPHYHFIPQVPHAHGVVEPQPTPIAFQPTPTLLHPTQLEPQAPTVIQPTQPQPAVHLDHDGWSPVQPHAMHDLTAAHHYIQEQNHQLAHAAHEQAHHLIQEQNHQLAHEQAHHFIQEQNHNLAHEQAHHFIQDQNHQLAHDQAHHVAQEQGAQVYEHHTTEEQQYHEFQHQLQQHIQHQIEQAQLEQHQLNQEYGALQHQQQHLAQEYGQPQQEYHQPQDYHQGQDYAQPNQEYGSPQQQLSQEYGAPQHLGQEYGTPQQGFEGRSSEGEGEEQKYSNPFPVAQQPPLDRPLEHFR